MRILIYKRTHTGDPSPNGEFGCYDCMGSVRKRNFDAVIGVGGQGTDPRECGIAGKINWVGIGPHKSAGEYPGSRGPIVTFDHFLLMEHRGPELATFGGYLARHLYETNRRVVMLDTIGGKLYEEATEILELALNEPASKSRRVTVLFKAGSCRPRSSCR